MAFVRKWTREREEVFLIQIGSHLVEDDSNIPKWKTSNQVESQNS
jgi:hypothetical protein